MIEKPVEKKRPPFILIVLGGIIFICVVCVVGTSVMDSLGLVPTRTPTLVPTNTLPPEPTSTPLPSETPLPTDTPAPTETPPPTLTPTPLPEPIILTGAGDSVVDLSKWNGPAILRVAHNGGGNFIVQNSDANGNHIDLLINTIGAYQGTLPLDFLDSEHTIRFEITAGGAWEIQVLPFEMARKENVPGTFQGIGDEVIVFTGADSPDLLKADASGGSGNFIVLTFGSSGRDLAFNEIAPYTGTVAVTRGTYLIVITATGPWSIEVTTR